VSTHPTRPRQPSAPEIVVGRDRSRHRGIARVTILTPGSALALGAAVLAAVHLVGSSTVEPAARIDVRSTHGLALALTPGRDGEWLVAAIDDARVRCLSARSGLGRAKPRGLLLPGHVAAFSRDGTTLAAGGWGIVTVRNTASVSPRLVIRMDDDLIGPMALNDDGTTLAAIGHHTVTTWETTSGRLLVRIDCTSAKAEAVALAPDGWTLAVGDSDGLVRLVDLPSGRLRIAFRALP
jgi:WD40 repeat protein